MSLRNFPFTFNALTFLKLNTNSENYAVNSSHLYFRKLSKNCFHSLAPFCPWS